MNSSWPLSFGGYECSPRVVFLGRLWRFFCHIAAWRLINWRRGRCRGARTRSDWPLEKVFTLSHVHSHNKRRTSGDEWRGDEWRGDEWRGEERRRDETRRNETRGEKEGCSYFISLSLSERSHSAASPAVETSLVESFILAFALRASLLL